LCTTFQLDPRVSPAWLAIRISDLLEERRRILEDAQNLKQYAIYYLHPEIPIESGLCARCYFNRPSAPQQESMDNAEERHRVLKECHALRNYAGLYLHPEYRTPIPVDEFEPETEIERLEREQVLHDTMILKQYARFYLHPELPVITTDPAACARCYFDRPSTPEQEARDEMEEHTHILEEVELLKTYAKFYLHPEVPVETKDFAARERCYFDRPSAPERNSWEEAEERHQILVDAAKLEVLAQLRHHDHLMERDYFHCKCALGEDPFHAAHDDPIRGECEGGKAEGDGNLSQSPPSIFGFA
jgi:hypothetical protein